MGKEEFINKIKEINTALDLGLLGRSFEYAQKIYGDQKRLSGQSLLDHCIEISLALAQMNLGSLMVGAGLLHEALERANINRDELKKQFGEEMTFLVEGVTNIGKVEHKGAKRNIENLRKLFLATGKDIRVILIKLINRLYGLKTISVFPIEKQKRLAQETLEIYAPVAYRLGMRKISGELEDLAFPIVYPEKYNWLVNQIKDKYQEREKYLKKFIPLIKTELAKAKIKPIEIHFRAKHYFSLYQKLQRYEMDLNRIYDLVALRIIVESIDECYGALGAIHKIFKPLPGRIKDYIALPKTNGYRSLHTTVFCPEGKISEIQIRTPEMQREAEYGIAAHWYYSETKGFKNYIKRFFSKPPEKELAWIQQISQWQEEISGEESKDFIKSLKIDFFKDRIFVFSPKGDVFDLPSGATPVDFAFSVHTSIGHRCSGAKVDGKITALNQPLKNGQVVEIITQKEEKPSRDWLRFVKTSVARSKIRAWFKKSESANFFLEPGFLEKIKQKVIPFAKKPPATQISKTLAVEVKGGANVLTKFARCCRPQPPQLISGYITVNRGVTVHRADCPNLKKIKNTARLIPVSWKE